MSPSRAAHLVVDLGFGDSGKGTLTDWLVRRHGAGLVVRFNGGAQAGHNVITEDGRHHTFSQFGAGSFVPGVRTHLARSTVLHPLAMRVEARYLAERGVPDALARTTVSEHARVITPFHQAAGRLRELARGAGRHGTCGVGVGETVRDALANPADALHARDLGEPVSLARKARTAQERLRSELSEVMRAARTHPHAEPELALLEDTDVASRWAQAVQTLRPRERVVGDEWLGTALREGTTVFEGAQGVLLDEWRGFHPHTTWSTCTFDLALELLHAHGFDGEVHRLGVLRTYASRHGEGPFPTEEPALAPALPEPHNGAAGWQGRFRVGGFDAVLARYALASCGGVDSLALTHLDRLMDRWPVCTAYRAPSTHDDVLIRGTVDPSHVTGLRLGPHRDLAHQERLTRALSACTPVREELDLGEQASDRFVSWVEATLGVRVSVTSHGPTARDKRERGLTGPTPPR
ncbi:adenylosuccinate synthetase [Pyxidicoccus parkwayensis]|uniref:Adenylosuccinate synthetase n=1 Tax=Pyxidicoccus parkwayensis TaxID=2813578 RepID=A0ABX7NK99_9BACT|nr:adenylosuccinate synthetase [Pyxidicoccus parkwaysis]QSQ18876.1 adenylosuccinate synthetase [Pyxidicoccus parkwaysis]